MTKHYLYLPLGLCLLAAGCGPAADEPGTKTTDSGLKILDRVVGDGEPAKVGDTVEIHFTGTVLADGTKFDSTYENNKPAIFTIGAGERIKGFDEGIPGMKPGGKRKLVVPWHLGYGDRAMPKIPPQSDLLFEVELLRILPPVPRVKTLEKDDLKVGEGPEVKNGDRVEVIYTGRLKSNGKQFDSNVGSGKTFSLQVGLGEVIKGWDLGLLGMKVGGQRRLSIPAALGYGARGAGNDIPPDADLEFDVELVRIK